MIEELKTLIDALAGVPNLVAIVAMAFLVFKLATLASILAVIAKCWQWTIEAVKHIVDKRAEIRAQPVEVRTSFEGLIISGREVELATVLKRIRNKGHATDSKYIHSCDIEWLDKAISLQERVDEGALQLVDMRDCE